MIRTFKLLVFRIRQRVTRPPHLQIDANNDITHDLYSISEAQHSELLNWSLEIIKESTKWKSHAKSDGEWNEAENEQIYIEILELLSTLKKLTSSKEQLLHNPEKGLNRILKSLDILHNTTTQLLRRRDVVEIMPPNIGEIPNGVECRVVDTQENSSVPSGAVLSIVRKGYRLGQKILVPTEVISAK